jgi:hypothetical protein
VQELRLRLRLAREEVDVVDREQVDPPLRLSERVDGAVPQRREELVRELLGGHVADHLPREPLATAPADPLEQVGLSHAALAVHEEQRRGGVSFGDPSRRVEGEVVARAEHEILEPPQRGAARRRLLGGGGCDASPDGTGDGGGGESLAVLVLG